MAAFSEHIVFVDESGSATLSGIDSEYPIFVLAFMIVRKQDYTREIVPAIQEFKLRHFGHDQVILHEREIRKDLGDFRFLKEKQRKKQFIDELSNLIENAPIQLICVVINKEELKAKYRSPSSPYDIALKFGLERIHDLLIRENEWKRNEENSIVHIIVEKRGKAEDSELELEFRRISDRENSTIRTFHFRLVFADKKSNSSGLQLADLIARPVGLRVLRPLQDNRAYEILEKKLVRNNGILDGHGLKIFP